MLLVYEGDLVCVIYGGIVFYMVKFYVMYGGFVKLFGERQRKYSRSRTWYHYMASSEHCPSSLFPRFSRIPTVMQQFDK